MGDGPTRAGDPHDAAGTERHRTASHDTLSLMAKHRQTQTTRDGSAPTPSLSRRERRKKARDTATTPHSPSPPVTPASLHAMSRRDALTMLALGLLVAVSYVPATMAGFVWDDVILTSAEPVRAVSGLWNIWFSPSDIKSEGHYWPLVYTTFWLEHKLWGMAPTGYHVVNVCLHAVNTLVLWHLLRRLAAPGTLMIAAVFAVHPLHVESVVWVIERKDLLSGLFYLTTVLAWIRFVEKPRTGRYLVALALFVAGMLSKSIVVTLPVALGIWHWWQQGRVYALDVRRLAPFVVVGLGITAGDLVFSASVSSGSLDYSVIERALIAARALWFYAGKLLWPANLAVIYPRWDIRMADPLAWSYVVAAVAVAAALWALRHRIGRGPLAGALFFAVTLSPTLGFVDYSYMQFAFVADRYQYLAGTGLMAVVIGAAAYGVTAVRNAGRLPEAAYKGVLGVAVVALVILGTLTWRQAGIYRDDVTFNTHIIALNPEARDVHLRLGTALVETGRPEESLAAFRIAATRHPDSASAHTGIGRALLQLKQFDEAEASLRHALTLNARDTTALQSLADLLRSQGRYEEALEGYRAVLAVDRGYAPAHLGTGHTLLNLRRYDELLTRMNPILALQPNSPLARSLLSLMGQASQALGRLDAAAEYYERALRIDPRFSAPLAHLATLRLKQGRYQDALTILQAFVEAEPGNASAHHGMGVAFQKLGKLDEARASLDRALSLNPTMEAARALREQIRQHSGL